MNAYHLDTLFLGLVLTLLVGILVFLVITIYFAYAKLDLMLRHLQNCPAVTIRASLQKGGLFGRLFVLSGVIGVITRPAGYLRDGGASQKDLDNFPHDLKRKLSTLQATGWVLLLLMVVLWVIGKLTGWPN